MDRRICDFSMAKEIDAKESYIIANQICSTGTSIDIQVGGLSGSYSASVPEPIFIHEFEDDDEIYSPWDTMIFNPYYTGESREVEILTQYQTLREFSLKLLENTKDMDVEIAKVVKENFWDLL